MRKVVLVFVAIALFAGLIGYTSFSVSKAESNADSKAAAFPPVHKPFPSEQYEIKLAPESDAWHMDGNKTVLDRTGFVFR